MEDTRLRVLTTSGVEFVEVSEPYERSLVGQHWNAVRTFLGKGDDSGLRQFEGETVARRPLETDLETIEEWARRGELDFPDIYES